MSFRGRRVVLCHTVSQRLQEGALAPAQSPAAPPANAALVPLKEKQTDAWHRELNDGRSEIMCRAPGYRLRVSGPEEFVWDVVELFEERTGLTVQSERRPRRRQRVPTGQLTMTELESECDGDG